MKEFVRLVGIVVPASALLAFGFWVTLVVEPAQVSELIDDPPAWLVVVGIVTLTFGGALLAAFLARERPRPVASKATVSRKSLRTSAPAAGVTTTLSPLQETLPPRAIVPPPPPPPAQRSGGVRPFGLASRSLLRRMAGALARVVTQGLGAAWHGTRVSMVAIPHAAPRVLGGSRAAVRRAEWLAGAGGAAVMRMTSHTGAGMAAIARHLRGRNARPQEVQGPPEWRAYAKAVHAELGGDLTTLLQVADLLDSRYRYQFERVAQDLVRAVRMARRRVRYAAWALSALVPGVMVTRGLLDPGYLQRLVANGPTPEIVGAALLTVCGIWWVHHMARPPFSAVPFAARKRERDTATVRRLAILLDHSAIYAAAGLSVEDALDRAMRRDPEGADARLLALLQAPAAAELSARDRNSPVHRCALTLVRRLADGAQPPDAFSFAATQLRLEHEWAAWRGASKLHLPLVLPLLTCILPAALLLARQ